MPYLPAMQSANVIAIMDEALTAGRRDFGASEDVMPFAAVLQKTYQKGSYLLIVFGEERTALADCFLTDLKNFVAIYNAVSFAEIFCRVFHASIRVIRYVASSFRAGNLARSLFVKQQISDCRFEDRMSAGQLQSVIDATISG